MTTQKIVLPEQIEQELLQIWKNLSQKNMTRACLFTLFVYTELNEKADLLRLLVSQVIGRYPCRVIFLSLDTQHNFSYLKTAVSVLTPTENPHTACDSIDIGFTKDTMIKVPSCILPHIIADLPIYTLWAGKIEEKNPILDQLLSLSHKMIYDSQYIQDFSLFLEQLEAFHQKNYTFSDLNWARIDPWKKAFASYFTTEDHWQLLHQTTNITLYYNQSKHFLSHIQALYFQGWLMSRLEMHRQTKKDDLITYTKKNHTCTVQLVEKTSSLTPGGILELMLKTAKQSIRLIRDPHQPESILIQKQSDTTCDLPILFYVGHNTTHRSLAEEMIQKKGSDHFLQTLALVK